MWKKTISTKVSVLIIIILFTGASCIPIISGIDSTHSTQNQQFIGMEPAHKVAQEKLRELGKTDYILESSFKVQNDKNILLYYVFNLHPQGYLVVSDSYDLPPVIAYSFTSNFQTDSSDPNILQEMISLDLTLRLTNIPQLPTSLIEKRHQTWDALLTQTPYDVSENFQQWPPEGSTTTGGWIETNWQQQDPYNKYCPLDKTNGGRSVAGCPSTAMAQILNYHERLNNVRFNDSDDYHHTYDGNNYWIDNDHVSYDFPSFPELNTYLDTLTFHYEHHTPPTNDDAAALTFACGVAAKQVYGAAGSGTFGVGQAYNAYLKFNCSTCVLLHPNDADVYGRLSKNMIDALPAHLAIVNEDWTSGHNVVVDGYNTDDFFHVNFGWGGQYNGWYLLPDDLPYQLTVLEGVIVDIMGNHTGPQVSCGGSLHWADIKPGETVIGSFTVKNAGTPGSQLNWEITEHPDWGTWSFAPNNGTALAPENNPITINVTVTAPQKRNRNLTGYIRVVNTDDPTDCYIVQVSLATPYTSSFSLLHILQMLLEKFPHAFPILQYLMGF